MGRGSNMTRAGVVAGGELARGGACLLVAGRACSWRGEFARGGACLGRYLYQRPKHNATNVVELPYCNNEQQKTTY
ncbi:MAG: hypothetical protein J6Q33_02465 [Alistipes sp.]|nr:hypothetical protein [Alistipes sp.]